MLDYTFSEDTDIHTYCIHIDVRLYIFIRHITALTTFNIMYMIHDFSTMAFDVVACFKGKGGQCPLQGYHS